MKPPDAETLQLMRALETCTLETLTHEQHVRVAWGFLQCGSLPTVLAELPRKLQRYAAFKGAPEHYHETITFAFTCLIHERMQQSPVDSWPLFARQNPDLFDRELLEGYYSKADLDSPFARRVFMLPNIRHRSPITG